MTGLSGSLRRAERPLKAALLAVVRALFRRRRVDPVVPALVSRILVVRQHNQLGDMLCATPLLHALRAGFPGARITLLTSPVNHAIMLHHPALDDVLVFDKRAFIGAGAFHPLRLVRYVRDLRRQRFDLVLVPATVSTSVTSDLLAFLTGARWRIGAGSLHGVVNPSAFLYTEEHALAWAGAEPVHQTQRNLDIARTLRLPQVPMTLSVGLTAQEHEMARKRLTATGFRPGVAFHVGAGKVPNRWPAERFVELIHRTSRDLGRGILLIAGPMDEEPVRSVRNALTIPIEVVENESIRTVASCLAEMSLLVSNDTGVMHVGAAAGVPVISLFGPTDPGQWAPPGPPHRYIQSRSGDIRDITVDEVYRAVVAMLRSTGAQEGRTAP